MTYYRQSIAATAAGLLLAAMASAASAEVTSEQAAALKATLTPLGAEKAGNKEGTIPTWEGGFTQVSPGYKSGAPRPDYFAKDKPLFSITGKNVDQYVDKLSEVTKALLKKYPDYRLDVYPTRRTAAAPQWVYDNTFKNATSAKTTKGGEGLEGAYGGIPFPIPKDGHEVLWNHRTAWLGENTFAHSSAYIVTSQGKPVLASKFEQWATYPYYYRDKDGKSFEGQISKARYSINGPASKAGEAFVKWEAAESDKAAVWMYQVGQRRVRRAPSIFYDAPNFVTSGIGLSDEVYGLVGPTDRHEMKLVGKKELYVPYNDNKAALATHEQLLKPNFPNPDLVRWELHRVWVVEATLKEGKRHVVPKRRYYVDEDTWNILLSDGWDAKGDLWRGYYVLPLVAPDIPALVAQTVNWGGFDLQAGGYYFSSSTLEMPVQYQSDQRRPATFFSSESLAEGGR